MAYFLIPDFLAFLDGTYSWYRDVKIMMNSELEGIERTESRPSQSNYRKLGTECARNLSAGVTTNIPTRYYRVLILSSNYCLSLPAANPLRVWVAG